VPALVEQSVTESSRTWFDLPRDTGPLEVSPTSPLRAGKYALWPSPSANDDPASFSFK
jgi:hypothetical protein